MIISSFCGTSMSLNGEVMVCFRGRLRGRHLALGSSLLSVSLRRLYSAAAQGWNGTGSFKSAAMLIMYLVTPIQTPVMSGFPSSRRGVGAVRFGFPSAFRGVPFVG